MSLIERRDMFGPRDVEDRQRKDEGRDWNESPTRQGTPRTAVSHQKLERGTEGSSLEPLEGAWPFQHLESGLLAFRVVTGYISLVCTPGMW